MEPHCVEVAFHYQEGNPARDRRSSGKSQLQEHMGEEQKATIKSPLFWRQATPNSLPPTWGGQHLTSFASLSWSSTLSTRVLV